MALVAFLAAHAGVPQPRQRIAGMFWPDSTDAQALTNLRWELYHRECADLCDLLCAARARTGDLAGAADAVRRRIQLQPLEEAGDRTLMLLQARPG